MKTLVNILLISGALIGAAFIASGEQASKTFHVTRSLRTPQDFRQLKAGDKIAYVCTQCSTVSSKTVASTDEAMALCKEGATVTCPSCNKVVKISRRGPRMADRQRPEIRYVNDQGEECGFVVKLDN